MTHADSTLTGRSGRPWRAGRLTNVGLLVLLLAAFASGLSAFWTGTPIAARAVTLTHGAVGLGLLLLVPWKSVIVRRGLRRDVARSRPVAGVGLALTLAVAVAAGLLHAVGGYHPRLGVTALTVHVGAAVLAVPLLVLHARRRRQRPRRADLSRRSVLRAGALAAGSLTAYGLVEVAAVGLGLPGQHRRGTGSYAVGSGEPDEMPVTQWFTDAVPAVDRESWHVSVGSTVVPVVSLGAPTDAVRAVLDCTGGWYAEQEWSGVRLDGMVAAVPPGFRSVDVVSVTGYRRRFGLDDLDRLLLATHAAGRPLSAGHGGPLRLVAPGRRGFWWVKWVSRIEPSSQPWWLQPPFPLQ